MSKPVAVNTVLPLIFEGNAFLTLFYSVKNDTSLTFLFIFATIVRDNHASLKLFRRPTFLRF